MRFRNNQPRVLAVVEAIRMSTFADINDGPWVKATLVIKSDIVIPMPLRHPTAHK